ncbi:MAG: hypothetical protein IKU13_09225 [Clostridia bacterium]|nr:hypothetical protein [Clostridia bacterium]
MRELKCPYCQSAMIFNGVKEFQLGHDSFEGDTHKWSGSMKVAVYECPKCGKYDMFKPENDEMNSYEVKIEKAKWSVLRR